MRIDSYASTMKLEGMWDYWRQAYWPASIAAKDGDMAQIDMITPATEVTASGACTFQGTITHHIAQRRTLLDRALARLAAPEMSLASIASCVVTVLRGGGKLLVAGNGGSAAEAQHFTAELVGRFQRERVPYAAIALTADAATVTAIANDYGYEHIFARQVFALGQPGDLLLAFSTSGESENLVRAAAAAREQEMTIVAIVGQRRCRLEGLADFAVRVPALDTALTQEIHMVITHLLCGIIESELCGEQR